MKLSNQDVISSENLEFLHLDIIPTLYLIKKNIF